MFSLFFFDDWYLAQRQNLVRHVGEPALVPEGTLEDPYVDPAWGYPSVIFDPDSQMWRCLYQGQAKDGRFVPVVAESHDGIHWELPDLSDRVPIPDRVCQHQLFGLDQFREWSGPYVDPTAVGTDSWLKGLVASRTSDPGRLGAALVTSPDGIHWQYADDGTWHSHGADPVAHTHWNSYRQTHVISSRPMTNDRRIALHETQDWKAFTEAELILQADALDTPCTEIYGMPVIPYEHMFIGLLWLYHTPPVVEAEQKYLRGKIDCQLSYSHNGWHFQRTVREPFLANSAPGHHGSGCIYPYSIVPDGDSLRIYSSASKGEHAQIRSQPESKQGAILLHSLRRDGFVFLEPEGGFGELVTRLLLLEAGGLEINVSAPTGEVRVQVSDAHGNPIEGYAYDDCLSFSGDATAWTPKWRDGRTLDALQDRVVRIHLTLANGRLYAIRGDFQVQTLSETRRFIEQGVRTPMRQGF